MYFARKMYSSVFLPNFTPATDFANRPKWEPETDDEVIRYMALPEVSAF